MERRTFWRLTVLARNLRLAKSADGFSLAAHLVWLYVAGGLLLLALFGFVVIPQLSSEPGGLIPLAFIALIVALGISSAAGRVEYLDGDIMLCRYFGSGRVRYRPDQIEGVAWTKKDWRFGVPVLRLAIGKDVRLGFMYEKPKEGQLPTAQKLATTVGVPYLGFVPRRELKTRLVRTKRRTTSS